jgi:hypothetical protein
VPKNGEEKDEKKNEKKRRFYTAFAASLRQ